MKPRILSVARLSLPFAMAIAALLGAPSAQGVNLWWDTNGVATTAAAATGTWTAGSTANWTTVLAGNLATVAQTTTNSDDLTFNATGMTAATITVSGTQAARTIAFNAATTLTGGTAINLGNASLGAGITFGNVANTISTPIILNSAATAIALTSTGNQPQTFGSAGTITGSATSGTQTLTIGTVGAIMSFGSIISDGGAGGTVGLTLNSVGAGVTTLSAANTYTGPTNILVGTLQISNAGTFTNTSAINLFPAGRLTVNVANQSLAKLASGTGVVAGSLLRYTTTQATGGTGPGTIFGTVELSVSNVNPDYTLDFGSGSILTNLIATTYTSPLTLSGSAFMDASAQVATYTTGGITASTSGTKTLNLIGSNTGANTISSVIGDGSGVIGVTKSGLGTWILSGVSNTYTGNTLVSGGTLQFADQTSLYNNGAAAPWSKTNINVANGATMAFRVGGFGQFTKDDIVTLLGLSDATTNGFMPGSIVGLDTTSGLLLLDSVIANPNTGANELGLTKLGSNTLILSQDNTYTGRTVISGGTLQLGDAGSTGKLSPSSVIVNNGNLTIYRSDAVVQGTDFSAAPITGTGSFTQAGTGTTTLSAANTFTGTTTVSDGTLNLTNALALQNSAIVITGTGSVTFTGFTAPTFGGLSGSSDIAALAGSTNVTLNPQTGSSFTYSGAIPDGVVGMPLIKNGAGIQILTGANLYTGTTIINRGTLTIGNSSTGSLNGTTGTALTFTGTGTFNVAEAAGSTQGMGALTLSAGDATITSTGIAAQTSTLTFASLAARPTGATANFTLAINSTAAQNQIVLTSNTNAPLDSSGSNNQGIFFGTTEYARYDATNNRFRAVIYATDSNTSAIVATGATLGIDDATRDVKVSGNITAQTTAAVNTLNLVGTTMTLSSTAQVLSVNGILASGGTLTTTGFVKTTPATTAGRIQPATVGGELVINSAGNLTLSASFQNNSSASSLTKTGAGTFTLGSSASTYSGGTVVNAGTVSFTDNQGANTDTFFGSGPVTFNPGTTMALNRTYVGNVLTLNNATVTAGNSFNSTLAGITTLAGISTINVTGNLTLNGNMSGAGGLIKTGTANVPVNGINTYTGPTTISGGGLTFKSSLYSNDASLWIPANITVDSGASLTLNVGGPGEFTIAQAGLMFSKLGGVVNNNGLKAGSQFGVDTRTSGGSFTISNNLTDASGIGGGAIGLRYVGNGTTSAANTLELTGANTYSGLTIVDRSGTIKVSSLNSVATNVGLGTIQSATSSLGRPTSVANGTIQLGTNTSFQGGSLTYTGTGETTDRVVNLGGANGSVYTIDQSGSGLLKFISNFTMTDLRGVQTITLQGSTAGTGEISGTLPNGAFDNPNRYIKSGTGTWTLSAANTFVGLTTVNGGALVLGNAAALRGGIGATGGLGALTFNGGVIGLGAGNFSRPLAAATTIGAVNFTGAGGFAAYGADRTVNLGGALASIAWATANTGFNGQTLILGNVTASHTVDFQNPLNMDAGTRTVQVDNGAAAVDGKISGILSNGSLTKTGLGTLALTAANTYTGLTTVNAGTLQLDMTGSGALDATSALTLGGGTFSVKGKAIGATSQTMGAFTLTAGTSSTLSLDPNGGTSTTLTLSDAWTRGTGATLLIDYSSGNAGARQVVTAGPTTGVVLTNGVYAGIMVKDSSGVIGFATRAAGVDQPITRYDETTGSPLAADSDDATLNFNSLNTIYSSGTLTWTNGGLLTTRSVNSLTIDTTNTGGTIDLGNSANVLTIASGGIFFKGPNNGIITGGQIGAANTELVVLQTGTGTLTINSLISSDAGSLTKNGTGTLILGAESTFTGATVVNEGLLKLGAAGTDPYSPLGTIDGLTSIAGTGAALDLGGITLATAEPLTLRGTGIANGGALLNSGVEATYSGVITLGATTRIVADNNIIFSSNSAITGSGFGLTLDGSATGNAVDRNIATGAGTLTKAGSGTWTLSGSNNYTGATTVTGGTLAITGSLGATAVSVNAGTLAGNGNIGGSVTIASGASHALTVATDPSSQVTRAITGSLVLTSGNILDLTAASTPADGVYVLATATVAISGAPTTVNYTNINGAVSTISVDNSSSPRRLLLNVGRNIIVTGAPILAVNTTYSTSSAATSFTVAATNLAGAPGNLVVTPPSGYQVSLNSGSGYSSSLNVPFGAADLAATQVFLRLPSTVSAGTYSGNITVSGGGATDAEIATVSSSVNPKALTISPAPSIASRAYDTTTTAGLLTIGSLSGLVGSETLSVTGAAADYPSADAGSYPGTVVTYTLVDGTGLASNYSLATGSATGVVIKATPTATLAVTSPLSVDFNGSPQAATVGITTSSVPGSVANILTGGAATQTAAAVYGVTADFVPTDTVNYNSLLGLSAGNFTINPASTYASWLTANAPATGFVTDTDSDGIPNGVENVMGTNPNAFNQGLTEVSSTANSVTFKHKLNPSIASDVTYGYRWSTDLTEWKASTETNTGGTTATISASAPVSGVVTVTITITGGPTAKLFGQLVATQQ
jgi:autotransporter-associated beta strand protein